MTVEDRSTYSLIGANLFGVAVALLLNMTLRDLMLVYWLQSVIIGVSYLVRMCKVWDFDLLRPMAFVLVYGLFHAGYLSFIMYDFREHGEELVGEALAGLLLCGLVFAAHEVYSTAGKLDRDWMAKSDAGDLGGIAVMRILPMHLPIVFYVGTGTRMASWLLFVGLKIVADVAMHVAEQKLALRSVRKATRDGESRRSRPPPRDRSFLPGVRHRTAAFRATRGKLRALEAEL